jgi:ATP:corrinoid adenosyltransferase
VSEARDEAHRESREERLRRRSRRERPLLIVNTGHGKGKSTASFGVMLRGWARGYKIGVYQFVKSGKWNVGEQRAAEALGNIDWFKQGDGWSTPPTWPARAGRRSSGVSPTRPTTCSCWTSLPIR